MREVPLLINPLVISLLLLFSTQSLSSYLRSVASDGDDEANLCVYTVYIRTSTIWKGGTDSTIGLAVAAADGYSVTITDLVGWGGLMGGGHDYYERGNLDIFSGRGPCLSAAACWMNLTSDGAGSHHGWYCNYVEVTITGPHMGCAQQKFTVDQWLATDAPPYKLYATRDYCGHDGSGSAGLPSEPRAAALI